MGVVEYTPEQLDELATRATSVREADHVSARDLAARIAARYGLTLDELLGPGRAHPGPRARAELYCALRERGWSYPRIGRLVGRDHTTVLAAVRSGRP